MCDIHPARGDITHRDDDERVIRGDKNILYRGRKPSAPAHDFETNLGRGRHIYQGVFKTYRIASGHERNVCENSQNAYNADILVILKDVLPFARNCFA